MCDVDELKQIILQRIHLMHLMNKTLEKSLERERRYKKELEETKFLLSKANEIIECLESSEVTECSQCNSYTFYERGGNCETCDSFLCEDCECSGCLVKHD